MFSFYQASFSIYYEMGGQETSNTVQEKYGATYPCSLGPSGLDNTGAGDSPSYRYDGIPGEPVTVFWPQRYTFEGKDRTLTHDQSNTVKYKERPK